ncbi:MAG: pantetheine-phosphate adenylyltransferase [Bacteroidetes bacterium]|nr:pantetheine-phosphate adenylyltransferase [Bacteroidota bacterium]
MNKIVIFPGSFDPITKGHENIIKRAIPLFDSIVVAVGENSEKKSYFKLKDRIQWIEEVLSDLPTVTVETYSGLTVDFCKQMKAKYLLRGLRTSADFEFERSIGQINKRLYPDIETVFMLAFPEFTPITSSIVRDVHRHKGNILDFIPTSIHSYFK